MGKEFVCDLCKPDFGVTHGRRVVAVDRAEIALAVHQHMAHGKILGHADDGVINRLVTVGVVFADNVTHNTCRLLVGSVPVIVELMHGEQHTPVHRLESVAGIGQGTPNNHAHGVIEVASPHFLFKANGQGFFGELGHVWLKAASGTTSDSTARQLSLDGNNRVHCAQDIASASQSRRSGMAQCLERPLFGASLKLFAAMLQFVTQKERHENIE